MKKILFLVTAPFLVFMTFQDNSHFCAGGIATHNCIETSLLPEAFCGQETKFLAENTYYRFLAGEISAAGIDLDDLTIPTGEPHTRYSTKYSFFDSNGDGIPELHLFSTRYYYVFTIRNKEIAVWRNLSPFPASWALKNGAFISHRFGTAPMSDEYSYFNLNFAGHEVDRINFSKYDKNENGVYDEHDDYWFDRVSVTKQVWDGLTQRYLGLDSAGNEEIRNQIEWTVLYS